MSHGDKDSYIRTFSGGKFWPLDPHPEDVNILDIAHHLSNLCRFTGATSDFYSVGQHSVLVSYLVPALKALLHDAPEAYINDISRPLKHSDYYATYRDIEAKNWIAICSKMKFSAWIEPWIKVADDRLLLAEKRDLMGGTGEKWRLVMDVEPYPYTIIPWTPKDTERTFLLRYTELGGVL